MANDILPSGASLLVARCSVRVYVFCLVVWVTNCHSFGLFRSLLSFDLVEVESYHSTALRLAGSVNGRREICSQLAAPPTATVTFDWVESRVGLAWLVG